MSCMARVEGYPEWDLRHRIYIARMLYFMSFVDLFAVSIILALINVRAKDLGASSTMIGILGSLYGAIQLFASPAFGSYSDIHGRKTVLLFCLMVSAVGYVGMALATSVILMCVARGIAASLCCKLVWPTLFPPSRALCATPITTPSLAWDSLSDPFAAAILLSCQMDFSGAGFWQDPCSFSTHYFSDNNSDSSNRSSTSKGSLPKERPVFQTQSPTATMVGSTSVASRRTIGTNASSVHDQLHDSPVVGNSPKEQTVSIFRHWKCLFVYWDLLLPRFLFTFAVIVYRSNLSLTVIEKYEVSRKTMTYIVSYQGALAAITGFMVTGMVRLVPNDKALVLLSGMMMGFSLFFTTSNNLLVLNLTLIPFCLSISVIKVVMMKITINRSPPHAVGAMVGLGQSVTSTSRMLAPLAAGVLQEYDIDGPSWVGSISAIIGSGVAWIWLQTENDPNLARCL